MREDLAELVFIVDRSGSMSSIASDMEGAIKSVIQDQQKNYDGDINVTFVRFDDKYEKVYESTPIDDIKDLEISPRGSTALLDAMGKTINSFERKFSETDEDERPDKVLFIVITDGYENASMEYTRDKVFGIIETAKRDHEWDFTFIGAEQDAIKEGSNLGIMRGKSLNYDKTTRGIGMMAQSLTNYTTSYLSTKEAMFDQSGEDDSQ